MPTVTFNCRDEHERLLVEQAIAYVTHLRQVAQDAPDGTVLDACERVALADGRALLRSTLAAALQGRVATAEQKGGLPAPVPRRTPDGTKVSTRAPF